MQKRKYNLGFLPDEVIYNYVKETVEKYTDCIDLASFNKNIIDPIKLTFDAKVYGKSFEDIIEAESIRQIDKTNQNHLGYFHQNLFKLAGNGWEVLDTGFDIINTERHIFVEMKTKHNTMNAGGAFAVVVKMQDKLLEDPKALCILVEVIAKHSQDIRWEGSFRGYKLRGTDRIRRMSIDKFYELVFGDRLAFCKLCQALPFIIDDVLEDLRKEGLKSSVYSELLSISSDTFKSLFLLAFSTYEGFENF